MAIFKKGHKQFNTGRTHFKKGDVHRGSPKIFKKCLYCNKEFLDYVKGKRKFCCKKCSDSSFIGKKRAPFSLETIEKMKKAQFISNKKPEVRINRGLARKGKKHWRWKGGLENENKIIRKSLDYKLWREEVFKRDNYTCQKCNKVSSAGSKLSLNPHHIKGFSQYPEERFNINNGSTLCVDCHREFHFLYGYIDIEQHWNDWIQ